MKKYLIVSTLIFCFGIAFSQTLNDKWLEQINQGKEEYAVNNYAEAINYFVKASQLVPTDTTAYVYILDCAYKTQDDPLFFKSFDKLLVLNHESARAYNQAIHLATEVEKDYQKAVMYVETARQKYPNDKDIMMADIMIYYQYGDYDAALKKLSAYLEHFPTDKKAIEMQYEIYYNVKKNIDSAIVVLDKAQQLFPDDQDFVKKEVNIYLETNQMDAAEEKFQKLIDLNPYEAKHYYNLSLILYNKGEYQKSIELASKAIELNPNFLDAIYNVGTYYYHRALQYNENLLKMTPYQYTYQEQGRNIELTAKSLFEAAKPYFQRAIELNTEELGAYQNMNTINVLLQNIEKNQKLTDPYFTDLENEEKHNVYPDYEMTGFELQYPNGGSSLKKGETAELAVTMKNSGQSPIENLEIRLMEPFVNPMLSYANRTTIPILNPGKDTTISIPIKYLMNNASTVGMERTEGSDNIIRFFATGTNGKYTDLQQVNIATGVGAAVAEVSGSNFSETVDIDFTPQARAKNFLLVIGIDNYQSWPKLNSAVEDAKKIKDVLVNHYQVNKENVFELYNSDATKANIINALIKIKGELTENDDVIIYYAGHGDYNTKTDEGAWIPVDAHLDSTQEYLDNTTLISFLNSINSKHTFLIADACFSGSLFVSSDDMTYKPNNDKIKSRWGFTSGNIEYVADGTQGESSPFAKYLVEALQENQRDYIAVTELISYVKFKVRNNALQTPIGRPLKIKGNEGGEFLLYTR